MVAIIQQALVEERSKALTSEKLSAEEKTSIQNVNVPFLAFGL